MASLSSSWWRSSSVTTDSSFYSVIQTLNQYLAHGQPLYMALYAAGIIFFTFFYTAVVFNPDDKGLFKGIYLPLDLWKRADAAGRFTGPRGGKVLTFRNVGRRINNSEFVGLVAGSWIGTSIEQSAVLSEIVRKVLETGKTVTIAIKHAVDIADHDMEAAQ